MPVTFLASANTFSFGLGGGDSSKNRTSSPSEMSLPSFGICMAGVPFSLGNSAPVGGDQEGGCREEDGTAGLSTSLALWRNL